ncbi:MAG: PBP1A family penicillin-binding protein [Acetobacteraceae bacterium]|nr:PBP1A family penicillin-binding protein [Acetobacteraceae bacterium]
MESRRERRQRGSARRRHRWRRVLASLLLLGLGGFLAAFVAASVVPLPPVPVAEATRIFDRDGELLARLFTQNRTTVPLSRIPTVLQQAVVAVEDSRFYRHRGIDPWSLLRAAYHNLRAGRIVEGGSTITQQLARNLFLTPERTLGRKLHEALLTLRLERTYSKAQILELYLNQIYFGHGAYGVEVASQTYFGKPVDRLDLAECALLAGLIRSPETYSPFRNPEGALARRRVVLDRMAALGYIARSQGEEAAAQPLRLASPASGAATEAPYFVQYIVDQLLARHPDLGPELYRGGLLIRTTLDLDMQRAANQALARDLPAPRAVVEGVPQPQAALVALEPSTGHILAMIGGRDFASTPFNRAVQARRQPGSAFKPFLYTAVIDLGYTPWSTKYCGPVSFPSGRERPYEPKDFGEGAEAYHYRDLTVREAVAVSDNVVAVEWMAEVGPETVIRYARLMGIDSPLEPSLPLALGTSEVTPLELARAYAPLANGGFRVEPVSVLKVVDRAGRVIEENQGRLTRVLPAEVAYVVTDLLQGVLEPGGTGAHLAEMLDRPAAGKTGTTQGFKDAWFVGYTPDLVAAVYVGYDEPVRSLEATGGALAGPVWADFVSLASRGLQARAFRRPPRVVTSRICTLTGRLAGPNCPSAWEVFVAGTEPWEQCRDLHLALGEDTAGEGEGEGREPGRTPAGVGPGTGESSAAAEPGDNQAPPAASGVRPPGKGSAPESPPPPSPGSGAGG